MSGFDFTWNAIQSGQIRELEKRIEILEQWIHYLQDKLEKKNEEDSKDSNIL